MSFSPNTIFQTLFSSWGSTTANLRSGFLLLFATQLALRYEFRYPANYLNRILPLYSPYPFVIVPDNACQRSFFKSSLSFDFIIVGAGPAGSVIAERLSRNPARKILLVEAGGDPLVESVVPQFFPFVINNTNTWRYHAEVVPTSANAFVNGCPMPFGKQLGGSTETNAMFYVCATDRDYDSWAAAVGNTGWNYANMLPLVKRTEGNTDSSIVGTGKYHGTTGSLKVSSTPKVEVYADILENAYSEIGYEILKDYNSQTYNGFVRIQHTISGGERQSAYRAFLVPAKNRTNLFFMKNTLATSIIFSGTRATGLNVKTKELLCPNIKLTATKEVIISAGGLGSPKILLQSGIGKPADLPAGIAPRKDLPVGYNLQDHVYAINFIKANPGAVDQRPIDVTLDAMEYFYNRTGPFSRLGITNAHGIINTQDPYATYSDVQVNYYKFSKDQEYMAIILENFGYKQEFIDTLYEENLYNEVIMVFNVLLNPQAKGTYKLRNSDPSSKPIITSNFLTNADDVDTMVRGIRKLEEIINTSAMQNVSAEMIRFNLPECDEQFDYATDEYWKCYMTYFSASLWHPTGTCKMGKASDGTAVVDSFLKVIGFTNLRVADASIMPSITSSNTQCPTYSIGQKAADLISAAWP